MYTAKMYHNRLTAGSAGGACNAPPDRPCSWVKEVGVCSGERKKTGDEGDMRGREVGEEGVGIRRKGGRGAGREHAMISYNLQVIPGTTFNDPARVDAGSG